MLMKQFFTSAAIVLGSLLASGEAYAATPGIIKRSDIPDWKSKIVEFKEACKSSATRATDAPGEVITEAPEGMAMSYEITYSGFFINRDHIEYVENYSASSEVIFAYDGYVYIKDLFSMVTAESYFRGEYMEDGSIEFKFPQTMYAESDPDYGVSWYDLTLAYSSNLDEQVPEPVTENNSIVFSVNYEDYSMEMNPLPEGTFVSAFVNGMMWCGFSETAISLKIGGADKDGVVLPDGVETKPFSYIYDSSLFGFQPLDGKPDFGYRINVGFDGDDVYMGGVFVDAPNSWIKGRKEGNKLIFPEKQYIGTMSGVLDFYLMFGKWTSEEHEDLELLPEGTEIVFEYDEATETIKATDKDVIMLMNASEEEVYALQFVEDPVYIYQPEASGAPLAPWGLMYKEGKSSGRFDINLPNITEDGVLLYPENMYYNIYLDDELLTFYADENSDFTEDTSDIPYTMNKTSIVRVKYASWHELIIPAVGFETISVQSVNVWNGEKYYSPLATLNITTGEMTTGVESIISNATSEASITYYDLSGRKATNPAKGIYVVSKTFSDGTVKVAKEVVR